MPHPVQSFVKHSVFLLYLFVGLSLLSWSCQRPEKEQEARGMGFSSGIIHEWDLEKLAQLQPELATYQEENQSLNLQLQSNRYQGLSLKMDTLGWADARYLVIECYHDNPYLINLVTNAYVKPYNPREPEEPSLDIKIGILPQLKTQMIWPLDMLDGEEIYLKRNPDQVSRQMKGVLNGNGVRMQDVTHFVIGVWPFRQPDYRPEVSISRIYLTSKKPSPLPPPEEPIVDSMGQWTTKDWPGKTASVGQLNQRLEEQYADLKEKSLPATWSKYGGLMRKKMKATGFFHTHHDGQRWWLVDPKGYAFLSYGVDGIRPGNSSVTAGSFRPCYSWLPESNPMYRDAFDETKNRKFPSFNYLKGNFIRKFGESYRNYWDEMTKNLMLDMRFNTIGNWSDKRFIQYADMPYVLPLKNFPSTSTTLFRDFPDVFDKEYARQAEAYAQQLEGYKDDPYLIGYFLRNEPHWAFGKNNLAFEMIKKNQESATEEKLISWLKAKYQKVTHLNEAWMTEFSSFEGLKNYNPQYREDITEVAYENLWEFSKLMVREYSRIPSEAVKAVDPNHLNLGMRFAYISSDLLYEGGEYYDVYCLNGYHYPGPPEETAEVAKRSGKPVMIGEFHFGAYDRGLPVCGVEAVKTQEDRAKMYRYYMEQGFARPEVVGIHYFIWNDQPLMGRFDGEALNIGLVDVCHQPYKELQDAARLTNQRLYGISTGAVPPVEDKAQQIPRIF